VAGARRTADVGGRRWRALFVAFLLAACAMAQTAPELHQRGRGDNPPQNTQAVKGYSALPADASGEYELDNNGSVVQITIEHGRLTGYVTKMEKETALTLFFDKSTIGGSRVSFTTKAVHGMRYSFQGEIVRGDTKSASFPGLYRMVGEWTTYRDGAQETKRVGLKSTPRLP
jgi:hypothetical protein